MSMMPCRVLCLLAIVLYSVGVSGATSATGKSAKSLSQSTKLTVKWGKATNKSVEEARTAKENCFSNTASFTGIVSEFDEFSKEIFKASQADVEDAQEKRTKAEEFLTNARNAAVSARAALDKWKEAVNATSSNAQKAREALKAFHRVSAVVMNEIGVGGGSSDDESITEKTVMAAFEQTSKVEVALMNAVQVEIDARERIPKAEEKVRSVEEAMIRVEKSIEEVMQLLPPGTDVTDAAALAAVIHAENSTLLEKIKRIKRKDGSSIPALLRVPLLLLLLFSVLGCMTVC
ncbi:hypothetical protein LSM04_007908 [Trypanosoma melophagium]|uniref:uncharacterized protein n=1 Tax=Trypanosoma melophagium TaxID=715481 RepID=UPI00351AAFBC|nr:hypothetical protein LSM04_007908 [Trypanosoma melophagium]